MKARALGSMATRVTKGPKVQAPGLKCPTEGCRTLLSRYNASDRCYLHDQSPYVKFLVEIQFQNEPFGSPAVLGDSK